MKKLYFCLLLGVLSWPVQAEDIPQKEEDEHLLLHTTYVWQKKQSIVTQTATQSLVTPMDKSYSLNLVAHVAKRVWDGAEVYLNAEIEQTAPFWAMADVGGASNQEDIVDRGRPTFFLSRAFLRQTWGEGGGQEYLAGSENQLSGKVDVNRWVLTAGQFSLVDIFGKNSYTFDPTLFFMNWSNSTYAAYDYAGDAHGYTWAVALERYQPDWVLRVSHAMLPKAQFGFNLDTNVLRHYGQQVELEHKHQVAGREGRARVLLWRNRGAFGQFLDAVQRRLPNRAPDVRAVQQFDRVKYGVGADFEQSITDNLGVFCRVMMSDGRSETWSYLDVDDSATVGVTLKGMSWDRPDDLLGFVVKNNYISPERRAYLLAGGVTLLNTQGAFAYGVQTIFETYYNWKLRDGVQFTVDYQRVNHPSFNQYRGPADVYGFRIHMEY